MEIVQIQQATVTKLVKLSLFVDSNLFLADPPSTIKFAKELIADCTTPVKERAVKP